MIEGWYCCGRWSRFLFLLLFSTPISISFSSLALVPPQFCNSRLYRSPRFITKSARWATVIFGDLLFDSSDECRPDCVVVCVVLCWFCYSEGVVIEFWRVVLVGVMPFYGKGLRCRHQCLYWFLFIWVARWWCWTVCGTLEVLLRGLDKWVYTFFVESDELALVECDHLSDDFHVLEGFCH